MQDKDDRIVFPIIWNSRVKKEYEQPNFDSPNPHYYVPIYLCSGSIVWNLHILEKIEALVNTLEAHYKAIMYDVKNFSKPLIDSLVKIII